MAFIYTGQSDNPTPEYVLPPEGEYMVRITAGEEKISKASGKQMIELVMEIEHPQYKSKLWDYIVDNDYAERRIGDIARSTGLQLTPNMTITGQTFVGRVGKVKLKHEYSNGSTRAKIDRWLAQAPAGQATQPELSGIPAVSQADRIPF